MEHLSKLRKNVRRHVFANKRTSQAAISISQIQNHLSLAYKKEQFWFEYFCVYESLFETKELAEEKAKSHSVANMCKWLHAKYGIGYKVILDLLRKEATNSNWKINSGVLSVDDKSSFLLSLENLSE